MQLVIFTLNRSIKNMVLEDEQQQSKRKRISHLSIPSRLLLQEIIVEILLRLPVESLLRCKSVCKSWYSLISGQYFINSHVKLWTNRHRYERHQYGHPRLIFIVSHKQRLSHKDSRFRLISSCNGLFCIVDKDTLTIYNPSTRIHKRLPFSGFLFVDYAFGYDDSTDDYKFVGVSFIDKK